MTGEIKIIDERKKEKRPRRRDFKWEVVVTAVFAVAILIYLMIPLESSTETNVSTFTSQNPPSTPDAIAQQQSLIEIEKQRSESLARMKDQVLSDPFPNAIADSIAAQLEYSPLPEISLSEEITGIPATPDPSEALLPPESPSTLYPRFQTKPPGNAPRYTSHRPGRSLSYFEKSPFTFYPDDDRGHSATPVATPATNLATVATQVATSATQIATPATQVATTATKTATPVVRFNELEPVVIHEGEFIEAVVLHRVEVDHSGSPVVAQVTRDFYSLKRNAVVIPKGTRVIGRATSVSNSHQRRLDVTFHRMILPGGHSIPLPTATGHHRSGSIGLATSHTSHTFKRLSSAIFLGLVDGLGGLVQNCLNQTSQWSPVIEESERSFRSAAAEVLRQNLTIKPTIKVRPGARIKIYIGRDIAITPFRRLRR